MVDGDRCCRCWIGRRWRWCDWWSRGLLLFFSRLVVTATDSDGGSANVAAGVTGVASAVPAGITGVASVAAAAVTTAAAATALSFSAVAFSVPLAMHLSRYGRLPSWNKSRTQCLVIFHSTMKEILTLAIRCNFPSIVFKHALSKIQCHLNEIILEFEMNPRRIKITLRKVFQE